MCDGAVCSSHASSVENLRSGRRLARCGQPMKRAPFTARTTPASAGGDRIRERSGLRTLTMGIGCRADASASP